VFFQQFPVYCLRACQVLNLITLVPQQGAFIINGQKWKYCVTLFAKETCQCVSTSTCYHIVAAKMSIGLEAIQKNRVDNLRALSKHL
jgi:hypothetical protein